MQARTHRVFVFFTGILFECLIGTIFVFKFIVFFKHFFPVFKILEKVVYFHHIGSKKREYFNIN